MALDNSSRPIGSSIYIVNPILHLYFVSFIHGNSLIMEPQICNDNSISTPYKDGDYLGTLTVSDHPQPHPSRDLARSDPRSTSAVELPPPWKTQWSTGPGPLLSCSCHFLVSASSFSLLHPVSHPAPWVLISDISFIVSRLSGFFLFFFYCDAPPSALSGSTISRQKTFASLLIGPSMFRLLPFFVVNCPLESRDMPWA